ncbi:MAG: hypothetical protein AB7O04_04135 [Hyphomonadaceae bacterium]
MRLFVVAFALFAALGASGSASAQQDAPERAPPEVLSGVYACAQIESDAERLACFDAAVGRMQQAQQAGDFAAVDRAQVREVERESFGFSLPSISRLMPRFGGGDDNEDEHEDGVSDNVEMVIQSVRERTMGVYVFTMTNGQVWSQVQGESVRNVPPGTTVTIRRAAAGSFMMASARGGSAHRVRREQ